MRYGYDLKNPMDREMYLEMRKREFERVNNIDLTLSQAYAEYLKDNKKEMEYFKFRDKMEKEQEKEIEKQIEEQIEKQLPDFIEKTIADLLKGF